MSAPLDLEELERLEKAATAAPWTHDAYKDPEFWRVFGPDYKRLFDEPYGGSESGCWSVADSGPDDLDLVCSLRNAAPALLSELRAARSALAVAEREREEMRKRIGVLCSIIENADWTTGAFKNGVTVDGSPDEGEVLTSRYVEDSRSALQRVRDGGSDG